AGGVAGVLAHQGDRRLGEILEAPGDLGGLVAGPGHEGCLEKARKVHPELVGARLVDDVGELPDDVVAEAIEIAAHPGADRRHLFADRRPALLDGALLSLEIGLDPRDAALDLLAAHAGGAAL